MENASAKDFINKLIADEKLRAEVRRTAIVDAVIRVAASHGYNFTEDDLREGYAEWYRQSVGATGAVSAEDLKDLASAGGAAGHAYDAAEYAKSEYHSSEYAATEYAAKPY